MPSAVTDTGVGSPIWTRIVAAQRFTGVATGIQQRCLSIANLWNALR